jgi:putative mRNA 3-end processing factor
LAGVLRETPDGLYCEPGNFHIDPWGATPRALITHAHGDHARPGSSRYLCTTSCAPLLARRLGHASLETMPYGERRRIGDVSVSFHPAGHILGSAQVRLECKGEVWVVSGDYKRAADPTCAPFEPLRCHVFVTESTFALPIYRWAGTQEVIAELLAWWQANARRGLASIAFCYTIGKAQRVLAELTAFTDRPVLVHGMMMPFIHDYRNAGVRMVPTATLVDRPRGTSLAGELVLAPPSARGTPWMRRLGEWSDALVSGLMRVRGVRRQRGYDRGLVLSDHADWPALLDTVAATGAARVLATHGHAEPFARYLREQGVDAGTLRTAWEGEGGADDHE